MVGGIYTVLSTRAATLCEQFNDNLIFIGPDIWSENESPYFEENVLQSADWKQFTERKFGLKIRCGRWLVPGRPQAILVDFTPLFAQKDKIYGDVWEQTGVNSLAAYGDYDEGSMFGYAAGMIIESYCQFFNVADNKKVIAHFNEWTTSFGLFYVRKNLPSIATVFTTHATSIGRSIAGNHKPLYNYLQEYNGDQMAVELNMISKHSTEKSAANLADCFTTVSEITARECEQLLNKQPDIVTPNGFEDNFVPSKNHFAEKRTKARQALTKVAETLLGYKISDNAIFVGTAGRYEYKNKGIDVFIEGLKFLSENAENQRETIAFIMVPAWVKCPRADLQKALQDNSPLDAFNRTTTHELNNYEDDSVINAVSWLNFRNLKTDKVKIVFVPSYLNGNDGIFDLKYYDLLIGLDLTVFASYYEPWGYTPLESVAFCVPTITTDLSGFGQWALPVSDNIIKGVAVIHRSDYNSYQVAANIAKIIFDYSKFTAAEVENARNAAKKLSKKALWSHFIKYYYQAYQVALSKKIEKL
jgi:glycogen synthase